MNDPQVLRAEQEYTQRVQQLLLSVIEQSTSISASHAEAVHMIVADAWDELRMKPTALSPQDLEQLSAEVDRYLVRKSFTDDLAARYKRMLMAPFFARVDFAEEGEKDPEKIVIGLYSLRGGMGRCWCTTGARRSARSTTIPCPVPAATTAPLARFAAR